MYADLEKKLKSQESVNGLK